MIKTDKNLNILVETWPIYTKSSEQGSFLWAGQNEFLWWEKIRQVVNQVKLAVPSHSEPLWQEKIGKVANQVKLAILSDTEQLWWEKIRKLVNWAKLAIPSNCEPFWWVKIGKVTNWAKLAIKSSSELCLHIAPGILLSVVHSLLYYLLAVFWQFSGGLLLVTRRLPEDH